MGDVLERGWDKYLAALRRNPLRTKAITAGVLGGTSDVLAQKISGAKTLQSRRVLFMVLYGFFYVGPFGHYFHKLMDRIFAGKKDGTSLLQRVVLEQVTSNPWNNLLYMSYIALVLEGKSWAATKARLQSGYPSVQLNSWKFWPIISLLNYRYMPQHLRVLFANLAAMCWGTFLIAKSRTRPALKEI